MQIPANCKYIGSKSQLTAPTYVLLNSRQSKRPSLADSWVSGCIGAVESLADRDLTLITSLGMNTWELVVHLANIHRLQQIILLPASSVDFARGHISEVVTDFHLDPDRTGFLTFERPSGSKRSPKAGWIKRDRLTLALADVLVPISIRNSGNLSQLVEQARAGGKHVESSFEVEYRSAMDRVSYKLDRDRLNPVLLADSGEYLTHWTRSSHGPYPGESSFEYYSDIISSTRYPRSAIDTLIRIANERRVRASCRFTRGSRQVVSLTSLDPIEAVKLMRWRKRYVYYNFEPYGISIRRSAADRIGIKPVNYGDDTTFDSLTEPQRPFFQNQGGAAADWTPEAEFRHLGDIELSQLDPKDVRLIVYHSQDAAKLASVAPYKVISLTVD